MNPLLVVFVGLNFAVLAAVYWVGSLLGLAVLMGLCFAIAFGLFVFSNATRGSRVSKEANRALGLNTTFLAALGKH